MALREVLAQFGIEFDDKALAKAEQKVEGTTQTLGRLGRIATQVGNGPLRVMKGNVSQLSDEHIAAARAAKALAESEAKLAKALKGASAESEDLTDEQLELVQQTRKARREFVAAQGAVHRYERRAKEMTRTNRLARRSMDALKVGAKAGAAAIAAMGIAGVVAGTQIAKALFGAQDQRRAIQAGFEGLLGTAEAGEQALKDVIEVAKDTAAPIDEVRQTLGTLLATGMDPKLAKDLSKMRFDFMAMGEEGEAAFGKLTDLMAEGEVSISSFEDLAKNLGGRDVLGEALGLSRFELSETEKGVEALQKRLKQIDPDAFLETVRDVAAARGEIGAISKESASFEKRLTSLAELTGHAFVAEMGIDDSAIADFFTRVEEFTESQAFKDFARETGNNLIALGHVARDVAKFIGDNWGTISAILKGVGTAVGVVVAIFTLAGASIMAPLLAIVAGIGYVIGKLEDLADFVTTSIASLGDVFAGVASEMTGAFGSAIDTVKAWFSDLWDTITDGLGDIAKRIKDLPGANLFFDTEAAEQSEQQRRTAQQQRREAIGGAAQRATVSTATHNNRIEANDQRQISVNVTVPEGTPRDIARRVGRETAAEVGSPSRDSFRSALVPLAR